MARYQRRLIISGTESNICPFDFPGETLFCEGSGEEAFSRFLADENLFSDVKEVIFMKDVWYGPVFPAEKWLDSLTGIDADLLFADPADPFAFLIVRESFPDKKRIRDSLSDGFCIPNHFLPLEGIPDPMHQFPLLLLENRAFPFVRKDLFYRNYPDTFAGGTAGSAGDLLEYLKNETSFDPGVILKDLIRHRNMADLKKNLCLDRVLSTVHSAPRKHTIRKIALRLHLYYEDEAAFCRKYIMNMPFGTDVYITVPDEAKKESAIRAFAGMPYRLEYRIVGNRGRDISAFLTGIKDIVNDYDLICVVHDKKVVQAEPRTIGSSWAYLCFENLLANRTFVENVIAEFENDEFLGMLQPPLPVHSVYYPVIGKGEWSGNASLVKETADMLGIRVDIDPEKEPVAPLGDMFWVRPRALKNFFDRDWDYTDFPAEPLGMDRTLLHAIERTYQFAVQEAGFYNAWLLSDSYARIAVDNLEYLNDENIREMKKRTGAADFQPMLDAFLAGSVHKNEDHRFDDQIEKEEA